jgi:hypothetical protein
MSVQIDDEARRIVIAARPGFSGRVMAEAVAKMFREQPQTASYDFVLDLRETETGATLDDYRIAAAAYAQAPRAAEPKYTCFVTVDPHYPLWAASMQHLFPDREHKVFVTRESAQKFLDEQRR